MQKGAPHRSVLRRWRCGVSFQPWGETKEKRSPKEQSAVSGTLIQVSQVVLDHPGRDHAIGWAKSDGSAPASKIVGGMGTNLANSAGLVVLCLQLRLSPTSKSWINNYGLRF